MKNNTLEVNMHEYSKPSEGISLGKSKIEQATNLRVQTERTFHKQTNKQEDEYSLFSFLDSQQKIIQKKKKGGGGEGEGINDHRTGVIIKWNSNMNGRKDS